MDILLHAPSFWGHHTLRLLHKRFGYTWMNQNDWLTRIHSQIFPSYIVCCVDFKDSSGEGTERERRGRMTEREIWEGGGRKEKRDRKSYSFRETASGIHSFIYQLMFLTPLRHGCSINCGTDVMRFTVKTSAMNVFTWKSEGMNFPPGFAEFVLFCEQCYENPDSFSNGSTWE